MFFRTRDCLIIAVGNPFKVVARSIARAQKLYTALARLDRTAIQKSLEVASANRPGNIGTPINTLQKATFSCSSCVEYLKIPVIGVNGVSLSSSKVRGRRV